MKFSPRQAAAALALAFLAACGGGGSTVDPFVPKRLIVFGDEQSLLTPDGKRYAVNAAQTVNGVNIADCSANPIWIQTVASGFDLVLAACNNSARPVNSLQYAQLGAKVSGVRAQIDQHFSSGSVGPTDLITVLAGLHDILELYTQYPALGEPQLLAAAGERGRALAQQVNRLASANGRILVLTIPNVGKTPFAVIERATRTDTNRATLLSNLTNEFNRQLRLNLIDDGRLIGLVLADELLDAFAEFPSSFGLNNVTQAACAEALPNCNTETLVLGATSTTWLWADNLRFGTSAHAQIGNSALQRAARNPF